MKCFVDRGQYFRWITRDELFAPGFNESCLRELEGNRNVILAFPRSITSMQLADLFVGMLPSSAHSQTRNGLREARYRHLLVEIRFDETRGLEQASLLGLYTEQDPV